MRIRTAKVTFNVFFWLGAILLASSAFAQGTSNVSSPSSPLAQPQKVWNLTTVLAGSTNLYDHQDGSRSDSADLMAILGLKFNSDYSASTVIAYSEDLRHPEGSGWGDTSVSFARRPWQLSQSMHLRPSMSVIIPTSKDSQTRQNLLVGIGAGLSLGTNEGLLVPGLSLKASLSLNRLVHQYETALDGRVNTQYSSKQGLTAAYEIGKFSFSIEFTHRNGLTYQNSLKESFEHSEEIAYTTSEKTSLAIGHSLAGSMYKANGQDSNIALMNENESRVYGSMTVAF